jgi:hypothetical protein
MVAQICLCSMAFVLRMDFSLYKFYARRDTVSRSKEVADSVHLDPWRTGICPVLFWMMCFVCYQNLVCVCGYIQLIWTLSVQEYVLFVLGDLLMCFKTAFR